MGRAERTRALLVAELARHKEINKRAPQGGGGHGDAQLQIEAQQVGDRAPEGAAPGVLPRCAAEERSPAAAARGAQRRVRRDAQNFRCGRPLLRARPPPRSQSRDPGTLRLQGTPGSR